MTVSDARYALLVHLAWELRAIPVSSWLVIPHFAEPVLYIPRRDGRKDAVLAVQRDGYWRLLWRGAELDGGTLGAAAQRIAMETAT